MSKISKPTIPKDLSLKYKYTSLNEMTVPGDYNFYGIIYDASFPYLNTDFPDTPFFECTIKVIDPNTNCLTNQKDFADSVVNLIIKASDKDSVPYIHSIGDIIRVHRGAYTHKENKKRNVYLNIVKGNMIKSAWCIFSGASDVLSREMNPYLCSHKNFTFELQDRNKIDELRNWLRNYFDKEGSLFYDREYKLDKRLINGSDNDALVHVVHKVELEDQLVFFVQDETDGCELHTFKYFNFIEKNDVLRLRSYKIYDKNVILMNTFSNILKIPQFSSYYKSFMNRLATKIKQIDPSADVPMYNLTKEIKTVASMSIDEMKSKTLLAKAKTNNEFETKRFDEITSEDNLFILNVNIMEIYPKPVYNFVNVLCQNCQSCYMISEVELDKNNRFQCEKCKTISIGKLHFNTTLQCRESSLSNQLITLHLCTFDNEGDNFFGIQPMDSYRNSNEFQKLGEVFKKMTSPDGYVSVLVQQYEGKVLRIVGKYDNYLN